MAVSTKLRWQVLKRDQFTCRYCGASAPDVKLEVDHITPKSKGGLDHISNLTTACEECNRGKSDDQMGMTAPYVLDEVEYLAKQCDLHPIDAYREAMTVRLSILDHIQVQCAVCWPNDLTGQWPPNYVVLRTIELYSLETYMDVLRIADDHFRGIGGKFTMPEVWQWIQRYLQEHYEAYERCI